MCDHVLQGHQQVRARRLGPQRDEARQDLGRHLHAGEHRLMGVWITNQHRQAQREVGDVWERSARRHRQRGERGEDRLLEVLGELGAALLVELVHADDADPVVGQRGSQLPFEAVGQPPPELEHALANQARSSPRGCQAVLAGRLHAGVDLLAQPRHAHHVELVEVGRVDRAELDALEQRQPWSSASCRTRSLKSSQDSSRLMYSLGSWLSSIRLAPSLEASTMADAGGAGGCRGSRATAQPYRCSAPDARRRSRRSAAPAGHGGPSAAPPVRRSGADAVRTPARMAVMLVGISDISPITLHASPCRHRKDHARVRI